MHNETPETEDQKKILRTVYNRYMHLYEEYFSDIDLLADKKIAQLNEYREVTESLVKYYYIDLPYDVCAGLAEFNEKYTDKMLGKGWHGFLSGSYDEFKAQSKNQNKGKEELKAEFAKEKLKAFYESMDYVFREAAGTESKTAEKTAGWFKKLFLGGGSKGEK